MYRGYNIINLDLESLNLNPNQIERLYDIGKGLYDDKASEVEKILKNYIIPASGVIDGEQIQKDWFPLVNVDVFISHSHSDEKLAITFAGLLKDCFGLTAFIDSCIWGHSDKLLKIIDNKYCRNSDDSYNYTARNFSTSHVHMMLMTALNKMIDKTECLFFLNTNNSVSLSGIETKTLSPWIYGEIEISRIIRKQLDPHRLRQIKHFSHSVALEKSLNESVQLQMQQPLDLDHFYKLKNSDLHKWFSAIFRAKAKTSEDCLNLLYLTTPKNN